MACQFTHLFTHLKTNRYNQPRLSASLELSEQSYHNHNENCTYMS